MALITRDEKKLHTTSAQKLLFLQTSYSRTAFGRPRPKSYDRPEPGTSGLEKTAPSGELEFSSRSN